MEGTKLCPDCAEDVRASADVCRFCGHAFRGGRAWRAHAAKRLVVVTVVALLFAAGVLWGMEQVWRNEGRKACENLHGPLADC
jgi:hypothetical protein